MVMKNTPAACAAPRRSARRASSTSRPASACSAWWPRTAGATSRRCCCRSPRCAENAPSPRGRRRPIPAPALRIGVCASAGTSLRRPELGRDADRAGTRTAAQAGGAPALRRRITRFSAPEESWGSAGPPSDRSFCSQATGGWG
ncbi:MAG: hypothetical protein MZV64_35270 [Ignavibacteriales bacterium]|nr:hypothetical protein [Ignavibacteriales bacterium]